MDRKYGFSVSEIVVTLLVIGVLAVLVMPTLMNSSQDTSNVTSWRKFYSNMKSAWDDVVFKYGGDVTGGFNSNQALLAPLIPLLNVYPDSVAKCATNVVGNCFVSSVPGLDPALQPQGKPGVKLLDGTSLYIAGSTGNMDCTTKSGSVAYCGVMVVDVNSSKGPNKLGKDIFVLYIKPSDIEPSGLTDAFPYQANCKNNEGRGCSAKYLIESNLIYNNK